jgi:hypothetical protein
MGGSTPLALGGDWHRELVKLASRGRETRKTGERKEYGIGIGIGTGPARTQPVSSARASSVPSVQHQTTHGMRDRQAAGPRRLQSGPYLRGTVERAGTAPRVSRAILDWRWMDDGWVVVVRCHRP